MIRREDFIEAIGKPDADFCEAVDSALNVIRAREENKKPRRYHMILPVAAAAAIFIVFMGAALRGGFAPRQQPGSGVLAPKVSRTPVVFTPAPVEAETPQPTLEAEMPYMTEAPEPTQEAYDAEYTPAPEAAVTAHCTEEPAYPEEGAEWRALSLEDAVLEEIQYILDGNIAALYPGFELKDISRENVDGRECLARWIGNGTYEMAVKWIEIASPEHIPEYLADAQNGRQFYAVSLDVPGSQARIDMMLNTGYEWQRAMYESGVSRMVGGMGVPADEAGMLTGMTVYLDEKGIINYVEMYFGDEFKGYMLWRYEGYDNGDFGYELLLDEYGVYGFDDIFGDPEVSATAEPTPGPTQIVVGRQAADKGVLPEEYELLMSGLGVELTEFYPGYVYAGQTVGVTEARGGRFDSDIWLISDGTTDIPAAWVTRGEVRLSEMGKGDILCPSLSIVTPDDYAAVDRAMLSSNESVMEAYFKSRDYVCELLEDPDAMSKGWELAGIKLTFDENGEMFIYEMFFGDEQKYYFMFVRADDGSFEMQEQYFDETGEYFSEYFGVAVEGLPADDMKLFEFAFGQSADALYPGSDGYYIEGDDKHAKIQAKYGADSVTAWSVSRGKLWDTYEYESGEGFVSVNAFMPEDEDAAEIFMKNCPDWLAALYSPGDGEEAGMPLAHVIVTYTPEGRLYACEMIYGHENTLYVRWLMDENGQPVLTESGGREVLD